MASRPPRKLHMEYTFPPAPPNYSQILIARWLLLGVAVTGIGILGYRFWQWKTIRRREMVYWCLIAIVDIVIAAFGTCEHRVWDDNSWMFAAAIAALSVSAAGVATGLYKCYSEGSKKELRIFVTIASTIAIGAGSIVVIAVIAEISAEPKRRRTAPVMLCLSNEHQLGMGLTNFDVKNRVTPPAISGNPAVSWRVSILEMLDNHSLFLKYDRQASWDAPQNFEVAATSLPFYRCPLNYYPEDDQGRWYSAFAMPTGPHAIGENPAGTRLEEITAGTGNTLLLVEASGSQIVWTEPRDVNVATQPTGINLKGTRPGHSAGWLSSYHGNGVNVVMADGSGRRLSLDTDPAILRKMASIDGRED